MSLLPVEQPLVNKFYQANKARGKAKGHEQVWVVKEKDIINIDITRYLSEKAVDESAAKLIPKNSVLFVSRVGVGKLFLSEIFLEN